MAVTSIIPAIQKDEVIDIPPNATNPEELQLSLSKNTQVQARMLAYLKLLDINPLASSEDIDIAKDKVESAIGANYTLATGDSHIVLQHNDARFDGTSPYEGILRTGIMITANGISMGYNDKVTGEWINTLVISAEGSIDIRNFNV